MIEWVGRSQFTLGGWCCSTDDALDQSVVKFCRMMVMTLGGRAVDVVTTVGLVHSFLKDKNTIVDNIVLRRRSTAQRRSDCGRSSLVVKGKDRFLTCMEQIRRKTSNVACYCYKASQPSAGTIGNHSVVHLSSSWTFHSKDFRLKGFRWPELRIRNPTLSYD